MKTKLLFILSIMTFAAATSQAATVKMKFDFSSYSGSYVTDNVSGITAQMKNSAAIYNMGKIYALNLGASSGYLDMTATAGNLIKSLDDYSISVYYRVSKDENITTAGNFLWAFSTSTACGSDTGVYTAYRLNAQRIATSTGGYANETGYDLATPSPKGKWMHVAYTQSQTTGTLYINGVLIATIDNMPLNTTNFNTAPAYCWIGRAPFSSDAYLTNTLVYDFELYEGELTAEEVADKAERLTDIEYEYKFGIPGSCTILNTAISKAQTALLSAESYLSGAVADLQDLVAKAQQMVSNGGYSQPYIDEMTTELNAAITDMINTSADAFVIADAISTAYDTDKGFKHPGGLHTQADFDRVKQQLADGNEKVTAAYNVLISSEYAQATIATWPVETIVRGGSSGQNYLNAARGATMAYQNALRWKIDGNTDNADAAVRILMAWARVTKMVSGDSNYALAAGLYGYQFAQAAELMRDYEGWSQEDFNEFKEWMLKVWYAPAIGFLRARNGTWENSGKWWRAPGHYWSNWGLCNALCVASIGILCDDVFIYNQGMSFFKYDQVGTYVNPRTADPILNDGLTDFLGNLVVTDLESQIETAAYGKLGQMNESGRDGGHAAMAAGLMVDLAKVGWSQGDDLFAYMDHRVASGIEYLAAQTQSVENLPWTNYKYTSNAYAYTDSRCWTMTGPALGAEIRRYWGTVIGIYEGVKGIEMPFSERAYEAMGIDGGATGAVSGPYDHLGYSVLMNTFDTQLAPANKVPTEITPNITYSGELSNIIPSLDMEQKIGNVSGTTIRHSELGGLINPFWTNLNTTLEPGTTLTLSPQLPTGETDTGNWTWSTGQTTRNITVTINESKIYRVNYVNSNGVKSEQIFSFAVKGDCNFTPNVKQYIEYDGTTYQTDEIEILAGEQVKLWIDGMVAWGEAIWDNGSTDNARTVTAYSDRQVQFYYVNQGGRKQLFTFNIHVKNLKPFITVDGTQYNNTSELQIPNGADVTLGVLIPEQFNNVEYNWNTGETTPTITLNDITESVTRTLTCTINGLEYNVTFNVEANFSKNKAEAEGWEKITEISTNDCEDYVYIIYDKYNEYMIGLADAVKNVSGHYALYYQQPEEPTKDIAKVWSFEVNGNNYAMRNLEYSVYQMQTEWNASYFFRTNDQTAACSWTGVDLNYNSYEDYWTIQATQYGGYLGPWGNVASDYLPAADGGYELAGNRTSTDAGLGKYLIYRMAREEFFAMYINDGGKGDITFMLRNPQCNGTTGWNNASAIKLRQSWRNNIDNTYLERTSNGTMSQTLENMPAGYYKVVAALRANTGCKITVALNDDTGTVFTGTGNSDTSVSQISMNGVQRPFTSQNGFQPETYSRGWQWGTAQTHLNEPGELQVKFITQGTSWMSFDDVYLYYSPDGNDYVTLAEGNFLANRGKTVTADIILESPNSIIESDEIVVTANNVNLINNLVDGNVENLILFDKYDYTVSSDFHADNAIMYRDFTNGSFYTMVLPFNATVNGNFYSPLIYRTSYLVFEKTDEVEAGIPYLFLANADINSFSASNTQAKAEINDNEGYNVYMNGSFQRYLLDYDTYVLSKGKLYVVNSDVYIPAFRGCFVIDAGGAEVKQMGIRLSDDENTDIMDLNQETPARQEVFSLDGRKLNTKQKGINIIRKTLNDGSIVTEKVISR